MWLYKWLYNVGFHLIRQVVTSLYESLAHTDWVRGTRQAILNIIKQKVTEFYKHKHLMQLKIHLKIKLRIAQSENHVT